MGGPTRQARQSREVKMLFSVCRRRGARGWFRWRRGDGGTRREKRKKGDVEHRRGKRKREGPGIKMTADEGKIS